MKCFESEKRVIFFVGTFHISFCLPYGLAFCESAKIGHWNCTGCVRLFRWWGHRVYRLFRCQNNESLSLEGYCVIFFKLMYFFSFLQVFLIEVYVSGKCTKLEKRYRAFHSLYKQVKDVLLLIFILKILMFLKYHNLLKFHISMATQQNAYVLTTITNILNYHLRF